MTTEPRSADPGAPIPEDRLPLATFRITCAALGYPSKDFPVPPPPVAAFAAAMRAAVEAMLAAPADSRNNAPGDPLRKASAGAVFAAVASLARNGLLPGIPGTPATGYLYAQNNVLTGRPSPLGRVRMANQAGADVETTAVGTSCILEMGKDGLVATFERDPDNPPLTWADLRGIVVSVTSHASGVVKMHWVSASEIAQRKAKSKGNVWTDHPIVMARTKALAVIGDRGAFPQAPLPIPGLREWQAAQAALPQPVPALPAAAPRALPAPAAEAPAPAAAPDAQPAAPQPPQDAPAAQPESAPADDAPAQPEPPQAPQSEAAAPAAAPTWDDAADAVWEALILTDAGRDADEADLSVALAGALAEASATAAAKGQPLVPSAVLTPKAKARLVDMAIKRLRSM